MEMDTMVEIIAEFIVVRRLILQTIVQDPQEVLTT